MTQTEIIRVMQQAIYTVISASAPMLAVGMGVGLIVSIIQATTQIHEQTLAFVPKILAIFIAMLLFGGFIITSLRDFMMTIFAYINSLPSLTR